MSNQARASGSSTVFGFWFLGFFFFVVVAVVVVVE